VAVIPFSQALRERTWSSHGDSEGADFMKDLMTGKGSRDDYIALVAQHYFIYDAIEAAADRFANDPIAASFISSQLTRLPAIEADLQFLIGADWRDQITSLPTATAYAARVQTIAKQDWAGGFIAHHYTRYLGDLSGGQVIRTLMQRQFGFETNGVGFYLFEQIAKPKEFKNTYREQLDAVQWDDAERERVINEVLIAYKFNADLFVDLSRAKAAA
jgi:heme oxygenase